MWQLWLLDIKCQWLCQCWWQLFQAFVCQKNGGLLSWLPPPGLKCEGDTFPAPVDTLLVTWPWPRPLWGSLSSQIYIFDLHTKFGDSCFSRSGYTIAGFEVKNRSPDPNHAPFKGDLSSVCWDLASLTCIQNLTTIASGVAYCLAKSGLALIQRQPWPALQRLATWLTLLQRLGSVYDYLWATSNALLSEIRRNRRFLKGRVSLSVNFT